MFFDSKISKKNLRVNYMRTTLQIAAPLKIGGITFSDKSDRLGEQSKFLRDFYLDVEDKVENGHNGDGFTATIYSDLH
jgi:hypothetical protein